MLFCLQIILLFVSMASAFPFPYPQGPAGPALAYPKAGPNGHYDAKHYFQVHFLHKIFPKENQMTFQTIQKFHK